MPRLGSAVERQGGRQTVHAREPKTNLAENFSGWVGVGSTPVVDPPGFSSGALSQTGKDVVGKVKGWFGA